ncbi:hypothetical protein TRICI_000864 [Trichomonascus ciferrii]|uniref:GDP-Man:Man(3)GlcNAc(2)-PP-Dol alpha-1,2-mannosyltransferase n=1 Tax=Trichomonascus ciferrii TaxID=44093 RepID=A0A642VBU8_9ASCO|nr:hypothetical protein TRICI_000864 [Trichomonascus ciferrii]
MLETLRASLPPLEVLTCIVIFAGIISAGCVYVTFCYVLYVLGTRLRTPPKGWKRYLDDAVAAGVVKLPDFGAAKAASIRRQLILASSQPGRYSNDRAMTLGRDIGRGAFDIHYKDGTQVNRKVVFGFFHPYADAGGGGERVLWAAVRQTLQNNENNVCAIYVGRDAAPNATTAAQGAASTGASPDAASGDAILDRVDARFGIEVDRARVVFIFIAHRTLVHPLTWPRLTLVGQAFGSAVLAYEAISSLVPDVFVDTAGYPFCYPLISWLLGIPVCAYVHYPVVQPDMLAGVGPLSVRGLYWRAFMRAYALMARYATLPVTNSTWTNEHMRRIWGPGAAKRPDLITTVYPPCAVQDFAPPTPGQVRKPHVVCIAQFRPEKRHDLLLREFARYLENRAADATDKPHLVLIGSVRDEADSQRVYSLRVLARELGIIEDHVTFLLDAPWSTVQEILSHASVGVNAMWNEHFGMGVVEYMAAGLIPVAHNSAGPKLDIITPPEDDSSGERPGFLFTDPSDPDYAPDAKHNVSLSQCLDQALSLSQEEQDRLRLQAYNAAQRFSDPEFDKRWDVRVNTLLKLEKLKRNKRLLAGAFD